MPDSPVVRLREFHARAESGGITTWSELRTWREDALGLLRSILPPDHERMEQFARYPNHTSYQRNRGYSPRGMPSEAEELGMKLDLLSSVLGGILTEVDARELSPPLLDMEGLHPWISGAVTGLWNDGHHRQAVDEATREIELRLKTKLGRPDLSGVPLVTAAFNPEDPRQGEPRLRFPEFDRVHDRRGWTNAHEGAMFFGRGCVMRIRNLFEHHDAELSQRMALECLAALSLLARWIDEAVVEEISAQ